MPRLEVALDSRLFLRVLRDPGQLRALSSDEFARVISAADNARLLGWLIDHASPESLPANAPTWLADRLTSASALVREYDRALGWEIDRLHRAFHGTGANWVLLKGAAYL